MTRAAARRSSPRHAAARVAARAEPAPDVRRTMDALRRVVRALRRSAHAAERGAGVSGAQLFVLQALAATPGLSIGELAVRAATHQSSVSLVVSKLVRAGLVSRVAGSRDARRSEVRLTAAGRALVRRTTPVAQARLVRALERLPAARRRAIARAIQTLAAALGAEHAPAVLFFEDAPRATRR